MTDAIWKKKNDQGSEKNEGITGTPQTQNNQFPEPDGGQVGAMKEDNSRN